MDGTIAARVVASFLVVVFLGCGGAPSFVLVEGANDKVGATPISVRQVAVKEEWRNGKRVTIRYATLLVHEPKSKEIERHLVAEGDGVIIGGVEYTVLAVEPGGERARARVTLQRSDE